MTIDEREKRFVDFVRSKFEQPLDERVFEFFTWKGIVLMRNSDMFHQVAQALEQKKLTMDRVGTIGYDIRVPGDFGSWTVELAAENDEEFYTKYSTQYEINKL